MKTRLAAALAALLLAAPPLAARADAAPGFATGAVNLRAGPGVEYPQITVVPGGAPVEVFGCLEGWGWCDVGYAGLRGWVAGSLLQLLYEERRVLLPGYAPRAGLPVIAFSLGDYWGRYYRDRPWYAERDRWGGPPPRYAAPPPPRWREGPPPPRWRDGPPGPPRWEEGRRGPLDRWEDGRRGGPPPWAGGPAHQGGGGRDWEDRGPRRDAGGPPGRRGDDGPGRGRGDGPGRGNDGPGRGDDGPGRGRGGPDR